MRGNASRSITSERSSSCISEKLRATTIRLDRKLIEGDLRLKYVVKIGLIQVQDLA